MSSLDRAYEFPRAKIRCGILGDVPSSVIVDTIQKLIRPLIFAHARIGRVRKTIVPYAPFGTAQKAVCRLAHSVGGPHGKGTNTLGG
jgi:hypothetical protein